MRSYVSGLLCATLLASLSDAGSVAAQAPSAPPTTAGTAATALAVPGQPSNITATSSSSEIRGTAAYRLGSGDKVRLTVYNEDTLSGEYEVDGSGNLSIQLIGAIPVRGRTVPEVIDIVRAKLKDGGYMLNPSVAMEVLNYRPFYVIGEVKEPGKYAYVSDMSVLNAVALAGGYTYRAKKDRVMIVRADDAEKKERPASPSDEVLPGDIIRITERFF